MATRRQFLAGSAALCASSLLPQRSWAAPSQRSFLFFFANGGWDTAQVFDFGTHVDSPDGSIVESSGNLRWLGGPGRGAVSSFFHRWGPRACIVNGVDTHSIGHGAGTRSVLTGGLEASLPDWPSRLAEEAAELPLPHIVFSGPSFPGPLGSLVARGGGGVLVDLMDGSVLGQSDEPAPNPARPLDALVDGFVRRRAESFRMERPMNPRADALAASLDRATELESRRFEIGLGADAVDLFDRARRATELMRLGLSRCAMLQIPGSWDTHGNNTPQTGNFDRFFGVLDRLMEHMARTPGRATTRLVDEVVVVVMSELGRTPRLNGGGGKDHWPFTSSLLVGPGVAGGRVVGATDDGLVARPVDFQTGQPGSGDVIGAEHLGASILALGGVDPRRGLGDVRRLDAVLA